MSTEYPVPLNVVQRRTGRYYAFDPKDNTWYSMISRRLKNGTRRLNRNHQYNKNRKLWRPIPILNQQPNISSYAFFVDPQTIQAPGFTSNNTSFRNLPIVPPMTLDPPQGNKNTKNKGSANLQAQKPVVKSAFFPKTNVGGATRKRSRPSS